ncbi:hypothetical protein Tco_1162462 [Tanacetum coccineum]
MFVQLQGDRKEPLDKEYVLVRIERICQKNIPLLGEEVWMLEDNLNFKFKQLDMWDKDEESVSWLDVMVWSLKIQIQILNLNVRIRIRIRDPMFECWEIKSTTRHNGVRECELSHVGVLGKGLSGEGLGLVVNRSDEDDKGNNQRIDWVNNHISIRKKRDWK